MAKITFFEHNNTEHVAEFEAGTTLMQIAVTNAVPGIDGDCGGECATWREWRASARSTGKKKAATRVAASRVGVREAR